MKPLMDGAFVTFTSNVTVPDFIDVSFMTEGLTATHVAEHGETGGASTTDRGILAEFKWTLETARITRMIATNSGARYLDANNL
jgi:hypothetical protein